MQYFQDRLSLGLFKRDVKHKRDMFKECVAGGGLNQLGVVLWRWGSDLFVQLVLLFKAKNLSRITN